MVFASCKSFKKDEQNMLCHADELRTESLAAFSLALLHMDTLVSADH